jgi:hypothetical protein
VARRDLDRPNPNRNALKKRMANRLARSMPIRPLRAFRATNHFRYIRWSPTLSALSGDSSCPSMTPPTPYLTISNEDRVRCGRLGGRYDRYPNQLEVGISPQESTKCIFQGEKNSTTPVVNFLRDLATFCNQKQKRQKYREYATGRIIVLEQWATLPS